nr:acyl-[acyl-carrier-protein] desaturase (EC 1.14.19.2) - avocado (fragments) [Persea americana]
DETGASPDYADILE